MSTIDTVRCITLDGFKYGRALLGRHVELDLPRDDFDRFKADGLVAAADEFGQIVDDAEQTRKAEQEAIQQKAQEEFQRDRAERIRLRREAEARADEDRAAALLKASERAGRRAKTARGVDAGR